ncbi:MAG: hypothetical protein KAS91_01690 [Candidatus Pacebacteria bacterium]|nr:hypothetical protein [Candidatus Paceibacterota bacterium]
MLKIAHRGASGYKLENTRTSFKEALRLKTDGVEFDVRLTKDKKIVVIHDKNLKRLTGHSGLVGSLTLKQIRKIKYKNGDNILTLAEVFKILNNKCVCKIDLKEDGMEEKIIKFIKKRHLEKRVIITTESSSIARKIRKISSDIKLSLGGLKKRMKAERIVRSVKNVKADIISPHYSIISKKLIREVRKNGLLIDAYTVNKKKDIAKMKKLGVDMITTDYPDRL